MVRVGALTVGLAACGFRHGSAPTDGPAAIDGPSAGLVAWYEMESLSLDAVPDSTGNGHVGECTTCPTVDTGHVGSGYRFSSGERFDVACTGGLAAMPALTAAFWMRIDGEITYYVCPVDKGLGPAGNDTWQFCLDPTRHMEFPTSDDVSLDRMTSTQLFPIAEWHHVAVAWDGSTKQLWYDGSLVTSDTGKTLAWDSRNVTIGADVDDPEAGTSWVPITGELDDLRIYDRALTATEISALAAM